LNEKKGFYSKFLKKYSSETDAGRLYHITPAGFERFLAGSKIEPKWEEIPDKVIIICAITGGNISREESPKIPYTPEEIAQSGIEAMDAGATGLHIHVRDIKTGRSITDPVLFRKVTDIISEKYPVGPKNILDLGTHGAAVMDIPLAGDRQVLTHTQALLDTVKPEERLIEVSPVRPCPTYLTDELVIATPENGIVHAEFLQENGMKPQIVAFHHGAVERAEKYLISTGVLKKPYYWIVMEGDSGTAVVDPISMCQSLLLYVEMIRKIDQKYGGKSVIIVGGCGRGGAYVITLAMILGLHVRVGMEDMIFKWPHKDTKTKSNADEVRRAVSIAQALGREVATPNEYRQIIGLPMRN
jgi:3-keto-5-aminohexanoate cleavage enzyme